MCSVPKTKCPVSAAVKARETVSKSLISPTKITSGSSLSAAFNAAANDWVCFPTSLCEIMLLLSVWINSTGSSTVIIFAVLVLFISFTIAASVVDLPDPVGPVTKTKPLCISIIS